MNLFATLSHYVHRRFIWLVLGSYVVAALAPSLGLQIRSVTWGAISLPMLMLAFLLFNAGMGVDLAALKQLRNTPWPLLLGLAANVFIPLAYIGTVMLTMRMWHNPDEVQNILVGLALVASMPIAGSSTAWSQNANGNLALSLGLVLGSTLLSPLATPLVLHAVGFMTTGDYSTDLHALAGTQTGWFLLVAVIIPSLLGILVRLGIGRERAMASKASLKLGNAAILLVLNYSNASISLPQAIANPDYDFLAVTLLIVSTLCLVAFLAGWGIWRLSRSEKSDQVALMFGLGMNNNGTGLVLASMALADHPQVLLPIIFYNLVQHLIAGTIDHVLFTRPDEEIPVVCPQHST
ncbi:bile acid:sodium symporter family protein [Blastopirellula marina]|uniref:Na+-dependent transporter n=1 Tax=Blastopirellula marina TaxID=124 RepID=A0A2S8GBV8_9BACT|nr:bile acid:sodium symporter [Blastopirellula marina]PQO41942.1 Na+-dependent transporter [Blastopirellula marina]PTL46300.1 Na+-dependent transporter [Blastopirellula marina]